MNCYGAFVNNTARVNSRYIYSIKYHKSTTEYLKNLPISEKLADIGGFNHRVSSSMYSFCRHFSDLRLLRSTNVQAAIVGREGTGKSSYLNPVSTQEKRSKVINC